MKYALVFKGISYAISDYDIKRTGKEYTIDFDDSVKSFEDNIGINILNYTTSISFLVGHSEISVNTNFGKIINIFNMFDSATLLGYLISYIYSSLKYHKKK